MPTLCDPCPGKMKAVVKGVPSRGCNVALDTLDEPAGREAIRHRHGVPHGFGARASVADNGDARETERGARRFE